MMTMCRTLVALTLVAGATLCSWASQIQDSASLEGKWSVITAVGPDEKGQLVKYTDDSISKWVVTFASTSEMKWEGAPALAPGGVDPIDRVRRLRAKYAIKPSTVGHGLDLTYELGIHAQQTAHAIYRIRDEGGDNVLTLRLPTNPTRARPTDFDKTGSAGCLTLRLVKSGSNK